MSFHTLRHDLKKAFKENVSKDGLKTTSLVKGVASSFGNFGDRITNVNHRHDEEHEQKADQEREEEKNRNRFRSFASQMPNNEFKWFVGGHDYMAAIAQAIESAQYEILVLDWWLSPELYLVRPPALNEKWRLDRTLARAAERGVDVRIIVYKEVESALGLLSVHTKHALEKLHPNIRVMRHPDHTALEGRSVTLFWAHHEKFMLIDRRVGFMGGIDLCYGRYDLNTHPIADMHPEFPEAIVFNGQEYNNARVKDFDNIENPKVDSIDRTKTPRMGWHDVSYQVLGPVCVSMERHFVERWEFLRVYKYLNRPKYTVLEVGVMTHEESGSSKFDKLRKLGDNFQKMSIKDHDDVETLEYYQNPDFNPDARMKFAVHDEASRQIYLPHPEAPESAAGNYNAQMVRSISDWSHGFLTEDSIQNAYIGLIKNAQHSVYIENQFFIAGGEFSQQDRFHNRIGDAIVDRILAAARANEKFHVIVIIPTLPGFPGDLKSDEALSVRAILGFQYKSINRGENSILERIAKAGFNPADYIQFFHLRSYDRLLPSKDFGNTIKSTRNENDRFSQTSNYMQQLRQNYCQYDDEARQLGARASISDCAFQTTPTILEEGWAYTDVNEAECFVTEILYIHSKLLIVDDSIVVCGSANINDRSMAGDHDSEIAMIIEEPPTLETLINGRPAKVSQFAASLRRYLIRKHLGLVQPHDLRGPVEAQIRAVERSAEFGSASFEAPLGVKGEFTPRMQPLPAPNEYDFGSEEDHLVADFLSDDFWGYLSQVARQNEGVFEEVFHTYPTNQVKTWSEYDSYLKDITETCHVVKKYANDPQGIREQLAKVRGSLIPMAHDFLLGEPVLVKPGIQYNDLVSAVYS